MALVITSPAFPDGGAIPSTYTCEGRNVSPPLVFAGIPPATETLVLIVDDPDAPDPRSPRMTWVHWVLYDIPPTCAGLPEGVRPADLPRGTREGTNDFRRTGYGGPCPPVGRHRYYHKLYALDIVLRDLGRPTKARVEVAMRGHVVEQAVLMGTYQKGR